MRRWRTNFWANVKYLNSRIVAHRYNLNQITNYFTHTIYQELLGYAINRYTFEISIFPGDSPDHRFGQSFYGYSLIFSNGNDVILNHLDFCIVSGYISPCQFKRFALDTATGKLHNQMGGKSIMGLLIKMYLRQKLCINFEVVATIILCYWVKQ